MNLEWVVFFVAAVFFLGGLGLGWCFWARFEIRSEFEPDPLRQEDDLPDNVIPLRIPLRRAA
ncbi:MAG: hypothetical protein ACRDJS_06905 [Actinomycetota bacterium]|jgi:hypothetical protein